MTFVGGGGEPASRDGSMGTLMVIWLSTNTCMCARMCVCMYVCVEVEGESKCNWGERERAPT